MRTRRESRFEQLSDRELLDAAQAVRGRERAATAQLVAALAEIDRRGLHLATGFASLYAYCIHRLGLSEHEAYLRMQAARTAQFYPVIVEMLADGRLTLTAVALVSSHLTSENVNSLLEAVSHRTKREILELLAALYPQPAARSSVSGVDVTEVRRDSSDAREAASRNGNGSDADPSTLVDAARAAFERSEVTPLAPDRYKLQVTISRESRAILQRLQDLMRHSVPDGDPAPIVERALQMLLGEVERRITAQTERPHRFTRCRSGSRYVPWHVRRSVWARDGGQCAYIGLAGRCPERAALQLHHVIPYAEGGETTVDNMELRCRAHNAYEGELLFGVVRRSRPVAKPASPDAPNEPGPSEPP